MSSNREVLIIKSSSEYNRLPDDPDWWKKAVFYQIYSFRDTLANGIGDLQGVIEKLDYLNDGTPNSLGIDAIWFSPFFVSPDLDFGYDVADYCAIASCYGTLQDFELLLEEAHRRNIRVILDLVVNHSSDEHPWFKESRSSRDNPKRDWYIWRDGRGPRNRPPNNWKNNPAVNIFQLLELPELQDKIYNKHHPETHRILKGFRKIFDEYPAITSVGEVNSENPATVASYYGTDNDELHMNFYFALAQ